MFWSKDIVLCKGIQPNSYEIQKHKPQQGQQQEWEEKEM